MLTHTSRGAEVVTPVGRREARLTRVALALEGVEALFDAVEHVEAAFDALEAGVTRR